MLGPLFTVAKFVGAGLAAKWAVRSVIVVKDEWDMHRARVEREKLKNELLRKQGRGEILTVEDLNKFDDLDKKK